MIAGFLDMPFSMNRYSYCFNTPMLLVDLDGAWPSLSDIGKGIKKGIKDVGNAINKGIQKVCETGKKVVKTAVDWVDEHKTELGVIAGAIGVSAITVLTFGAGGIVTAAVVGASVGVSATATVDIVRGETPVLKRILVQHLVVH